ncbi:MAG: MBL fold metallo-hydrolase [Asticcacaulis sp.]
MTLTQRPLLEHRHPDPDGAGWSRGLYYPAPEAPAPGTVHWIAEDVAWLRLPLPFSLDHINVWILRSTTGLVIVDTGLNTGLTRSLWTDVLTEHFEGVAVEGVIATHLHPDHLGLAGWLCEIHACPLWMSRSEYLTARMLMGQTGASVPDAHAAFYQAAGWSEAQLSAWRQGYGQFSRGVAPLPDQYHRLQDGQGLTIGQGAWTVITGGGHSPEHVCLYRASDGLLIGGDQVLPHISSNVSLWPTEPEADPLGEWLDSLMRLPERVADTALVLPSHGLPFVGLKARSEALIRGHHRRLARIWSAIETPARATDTFEAVFRRTIRDGELSLATGEVLAHLQYLVKQGLALACRDGSGVSWWSRVPGAEFVPPGDLSGPEESRDDPSH